MDYIYDIILNFQNDYYDFYEWYKTDKIMNIKRIPIYKISTKDYINIKNNNVTIDRNTIPKQTKSFLITSGIEVMGILIDNYGKVIKKSSLLFDENDEILENIDDMKLINIKYNIDKINKINYQSRMNKERILYVNKYLKKIDKVKDEYLLKYLYYDIYSKEESDINIVYNSIVELSKTNITKLYQSLYQINLELKK